MADVAVIILNWNGAHHLAQFLPSVVANTSGMAEIVVADNGSTDDSAALLERDFPTVEVLRLDRNYGFAGGYNRALAQTDADCCVLLNSDVETPAGWLEPLVRTLDEQPDVAAVAPKLLSYCDKTRFEYAGAAGGFIDWLGYPYCRGRIMQHTETDNGQYDDACDVFWASGAALCCRMSAFREAGGFDADFFAHMEEIDLCWRMQIAGWRIRVEPRSRVYHLGGGTLPVASPSKIFFNHRNNLMMLYKCAKPAQRWTVAVVRPLLDLAAAFSYLAGGSRGGFCAVFRAWREFLAAHRTLAAKRRAIMQMRRADPSRDISSRHILRGSIIIRRLLGIKK